MSENNVDWYVKTMCLHEFVVYVQIAPAESPDVTQRMVIITGPPEAQFKVKE